MRRACRAAQTAARCVCSATPQRRLKLAWSSPLRAALPSTATGGGPGGREGEHLARDPVPPLCSPSCSSLMSTAETRTSAARSSRLRIERGIRRRSDRRSDWRFKACGERLRACDLGAVNGADKRGVSNPRTGSGTAARQKRGVAHAPAPLPTVTRDGQRAAQSAARAVRQ
jgi:hypothetical protein